MSGHVDGQQAYFVPAAPPRAAHESPYDVVHADILRYFPELVVDLGGDAGALLAHCGSNLAELTAAGASVSYRLLVELLEHAATELQCLDFGLRLAAQQGGGRVFGQMGVVMKNSKTFGEALEYVEKHSHAHSLAARIRLERDPTEQTTFVRHDILVGGLPTKRQAVEQLMLLAQLNAIDITGGAARVRRVHFRHQPLSSRRTYRRYFDCEVRFDQKEDGVVYSDQDLRCPIVDPNAQAYEAATSLIDTQFTRVTPPMHALVRAVILQLLGSEQCNNTRVAAELRLHPRTLHRRLKAEGKAFHEIKDEVRRDAALYYIKQTDLDLTQIAERLGYAEHSVLTRSCARWFSAAPSQVRLQKSH
jgi:AraC-like DNA-binding protein